MDHAQEPNSQNPTTGHEDRLSLLPTEILVQIAEQLPAYSSRDFLQLLLVSKHYYQVLNCAWVWRSRFIDRFGQHVYDLEMAREKEGSNTTFAEEGRGSQSTGTNTPEAETLSANATDDYTDAVPLSTIQRWYGKHNRRMVQAKDMDIAHNNSMHWQTIPSTQSPFGFVSNLANVWWLDVLAPVNDLPSEDTRRYKVQWHLAVLHESPIVNTAFRLFEVGRGEDNQVDGPDNLFFQPASLQEFLRHTDKPNLNLIHQGPIWTSEPRTEPVEFLTFEHPGELLLEKGHNKKFIAQIRNHDTSVFRYGLQVDYVELVLVHD